MRAATLFDATRGTRIVTAFRSVLHGTCLLDGNHLPGNSGALVTRGCDPLEGPWLGEITVRRARGTDRISWRRQEITFGRRNFVAKLPYLARNWACRVGRRWTLVHYPSRSASRYIWATYCSLHQEVPHAKVPRVA
jgi:hypothetical protein